MAGRPQPPRFDGKVVLVTGASRGLGEACARRLADEGASVVLTGRSGARCQEIADELIADGASALAIQADIAEPADVRRMVQESIEWQGRLDGAINNAGISPPAALLADVDDDVWEETFNVNVRGMYHCLKHELAHMVQRGEGGAIVNLGSISSLGVQIPGVAPYAASKHAVHGLTRGAARDYARHGIRVNAICPGHTRTSIVEAHFGANPEAESSLLSRIPLGRIAEPHEMARSVLFLLSDDASFITGTTLLADGGLSM